MPVPPGHHFADAFLVYMTELILMLCPYFRADSIEDLLRRHWPCPANIFADMANAHTIQLEYTQLAGRRPRRLAAYQRALQQYMDTFHPTGIPQPPLADGAPAAGPTLWRPPIPPMRPANPATRFALPIHDEHPDDEAIGNDFDFDIGAFWSLAYGRTHMTGPPTLIIRPLRRNYQPVPDLAEEVGSDYDPDDDQPSSSKKRKTRQQAPKKKPVPVVAIPTTTRSGTQSNGAASGANGGCAVLAK